MSTSDPIKKHVIEAFQEIFPNDVIELDSDFFDLGGDSLTIVTFCTLLEEKMGFELHPSMMVYYPTVEELIAELTTRARADA